jgi:hypothetical protein
MATVAFAVYFDLVGLSVYLVYFSRSIMAKKALKTACFQGFLHFILRGYFLRRILIVNVFNLSKSCKLLERYKLEQINS